MGQHLYWQKSFDAMRLIVGGFHDYRGPRPLETVWSVSLNGFRDTEIMTLCTRDKAAILHILLKVCLVKMNNHLD